MRTDVFFNKKSVHVKLTRETHTLLREKLFRHGITMQDLFQEAAEMAVSEGVRSDKLLEKIAKKKLLASLQKIDSGQKTVVGDLDSEMLYNLLEETDDDKQSATE